MSRADPAAIAAVSPGDHDAVPAVYDLAVVGLGYVGLPLVLEAGRAGLRIAGVDANVSVVERLSSGRSHIADISDVEVKSALAVGFQPSTDDSVLAASGVIVICVPTPLDQAGQPDLSAVRDAARRAARGLRPGCLVVLESTTYPGTTDEIVRPILEESGLRAGHDFSLAFSPERIDPGNRTYGLGNIPKIVGGYSARCAQHAKEFYANFCDHVVLTSGTREAEMAKLLENTYRQVNIALVNEMAVFCRDLGIDLRDAIEAAATKPFGFQAFYPGPGVGGHCIPVDPGYLSYRVRQLGYPFRIAELAQEINQAMPTYVAQRIQDILNQDSKPLRGSTVLLLGVTYKPDVVDERGAPAQPLTRRLRRLGARVVFHDPYIDFWEVDGEQVPRHEDFRSADVTVLLQNHQVYDEDTLRQSPRLLDTRHVVMETSHGQHVEYL
jgi:UDP-N-acetyl-D-glucosamine dehydrogenase